MKQKECPSCGLDVDADSEICMYCQYEFPKQNKAYPIVAIVLILFFLWLILF